MVPIQQYSEAIGTISNIIRKSEQRYITFSIKWYRYSSIQERLVQIHIYCKKSGTCTLPVPGHAAWHAWFGHAIASTRRERMIELESRT